MQAMTFHQILKDCVRATGWDLSQPEVSSKIPVFTELINDCTRRAMEYEFWPDTMRLEQRAVSLVDAAITVTGTGDDSIDGRYELDDGTNQGRAQWKHVTSGYVIYYFNSWELAVTYNTAPLYTNDSEDSAPPFEDWQLGIAFGDVPVLSFYRFPNVDKGNRWDLVAMGRIEREACLFDGLPVAPQFRGALGQVEELNGRIYCNDVQLPDDPFVRFQLPASRVFQRGL